MDPQVLSAIIGAAMGAAFTYGGTQLQQYRDRTRVRQSMATMLLSELQSADATLRSIYEQPLGGTLAAEEFPLLRSPSTETLAMFSPATIQHLLAFGGYLRMVREVLDRIRSGQKSEAPWHAGVVTAVAAQAILMIVPLKAGLEREGGSYTPLVLPDAPPMSPGERRPPRLPASPFPAGPRKVIRDPVKSVRA
jgi:hypothetical protein